MRIIFSFFLFLPLFLYSQVSENFFDGDFYKNPNWFGDTSKFIVNQNFELQLNDTVPDVESVIHTNSNVIFNASWEFSVKMDFNPSSSNYSNIYLVSNSLSPEIASNAYFVKVGNTTDEISLYRQDGSEETKIIDGKDNRVDMSDVICRIRVTRDSIGNWALFSDTTGGSNYYNEGGVFDNTYLTGNYFSIYCKYTSTRATKFFFDSIEVSGTPYVDTVPPGVSNFKVITAKELEVVFIGNPDSSIYLPENYSLSNGMGNPDSIIVNGFNVCLFFEKYFPDQAELELIIKNIKDEENNIMEDYTFSFSYYYPKIFDIVINEIYADPNPGRGLPLYEYIEIYNNSNQKISLNNWKLIYGSNTKVFSQDTILPNEYIIICCYKAEIEYSAYGKTISLFSSETSLANSGSKIELKDEYGNIIHNLTYSDNMYEYSFQSEGGYSLEQIDPENPCNISTNWKASENELGGTPGAVNSVFASNPDIELPYAIRAGYFNDSTISVLFSEIIDSLTAFNLQSYSIDKINPVSTEWSSIDHTSIKLIFSKPFQKRIVYHLSISKSITDCVGNSLEDIRIFEFAIPEKADIDDIIINEVLFNPVADGSDFIELYNNSDKAFDLTDLVIASRNDDFEIIQTYKLANESLLLYPKEYLAVTTDAEQVEDYYITPDDAIVYEIENLPSYNNDKGRVVLMNDQNNIIDEMEYTEDMHFELLSDVEGVSLERISFAFPSSEKSNWHSASEFCNYGTPGYKNSQSQEIEQSDLRVNVEPEVFSPDNDGFNDLLLINFQLDEPGYIANVTIYDSKARLIKKVANSYLLGTETSLNWDGTKEQGGLSDTGIYMIYIELFNLKGEIEKIRKTCVLAKRMN